MKVAEFIRALARAQAEVGPEAEVSLIHEFIVMKEGYSRQNLVSVSDIRVANDWPLPGSSMIHEEPAHLKKKEVIIFFDLDSAVKGSTTA